MNYTKQIVLVKGKSIEIMIYQSMQGDFIATANFVGSEGRAVSREKDKELARNICIERLFQEGCLHRH